MESRRLVEELRGISEKPGYDVGDNMGFRPCEVHVVWGADHTSALIPPSTIAFHAGLPKAHSLFRSIISAGAPTVLLNLHKHK